MGIEVCEYKRVQKKVQEGTCKKGASGPKGVHVCTREHVSTKVQKLLCLYSASITLIFLCLWPLIFIMIFVAETDICNRDSANYIIISI